MLFHKQWEENTLGAAEAIVLLELLIVLERKGQQMQSSRINIRIDWKKECDKMTNKILKSNVFLGSWSWSWAFNNQEIARKDWFEDKLQLVRGFKD